MPVARVLQVMQRAIGMPVAPMVRVLQVVYWAVVLLVIRIARLVPLM